MPDDQEEWSGDEVVGLNRIVRQDLLPRFHAAIAEAILEIGGPFTDQRRVAVGSALIMTLAEAMLEIWAEGVEELPPEIAYRLLAGQLTRAMPVWLGLTKDPDIDSASRKTMQDVHERALRFSEQTAPALNDLSNAMDRAIEAPTEPHPHGPEGVAAALYASLGAHLARRFRIGDDPHRMQRWCQTVLAGFGIQQVDVVETIGGSRSKVVH